HSEQSRLKAEKAVQQLRSCVEETPQDLEAQGYLGWALAELGRTDEAAAALDGAVAGLQVTHDQEKVELFNQVYARYGIHRGAVGAGKGAPTAPVAPAPNRRPDGGSTEDALDAAVSALAADVQTTIRAKARNRVAVMPFSRLRGGVPELGLFLADKLTNRLFNGSLGF